MAAQIDFAAAESTSTPVAGNALNLALLQKDSAANTLVLGNGSAMTLAVAGGGTGTTTSTGTGSVVLSASPTLTGTPIAPTSAAASNTTQIANMAAVADGWWESAEQDITSGAVISIAHGIGRLPKDFQCFIRCKTADIGYTAGDEVRFSVANSSAPSYFTPGSDWVSATNTGIKLPAYVSPVAIAHKTTGVHTVVTNANWKIVFRAR